MKLAETELRAGLVEACDDPDLFGVELTPRQRELLAAVEAGSLLHVWALGRRSGKTLLSCLIGLWSCLLRPELREHVRRRERLYAVAVATNLRQSRIFVEQARSIVEGSPLLAGSVESVSDDEIRFANRSVLAGFPCTARGGRGWPVACLLLDEAAHMLDTDGNQAAGPVYRSLAPSVAQFGDMARILVASSPFGVDGWFADTFGTVEKGELEDAVCVQASTLSMRPGFQTAALELERRRDPDGYRSEYEAEFVAAGGAFLDASRIADAVARRQELRPGEIVSPEAAADLAFTGDSSALVIVGLDPNEDRLRLAVARSWSPRPGQPLSFGATLDEIADVCLAHDVRELHIDQFSSAAVIEHLRERGMRAVVEATTAQSKSAMFLNLKQRLYEGELELYEHADLLAELRRIETASTPGQATVRIRRLGSSHGDLATALALAVSKARLQEYNTTISVPRSRFWRLDDGVTRW